jgi:asparagine synthetase B (glutamine-hydrolysing)
VKLSGGLDSSVVACVLREVSSVSNLGCYSNVFDRWHSLDERFFSRAVVERIDAIRREVLADESWSLKGVPDRRRRPQVEPHQGWFYAQEEMLADAVEADGLSMLLDGIGGDELFAPSLTGGLYSDPWASSGMHRTILLRQHTRLMVNRGHSAALTTPLFDERMVPSFLRPSFVEEVSLLEQLRRPSEDLGVLGADGVTTQRLFSLYLFNKVVADRVWIEREILKPRGISGGHPLLDHRLVEAVFQVPVRDLGAPFLEKVLLRRICAGVLPKVVARRKLGRDLGEMYYYGLEREAERLLGLMRTPIVYELGLIDVERFEICLKDLLAGSKKMVSADPFHDMHMWQVITLEVWLRDQADRGSFSV